METIGMGGTSLKLYNDTVQRGRSSTITEADLSPEDLGGLKSIVEDHAKSTGRSSGSIDYKDYKGRADHNILGGFRYSIDQNNVITITDKYDFNADRGDPSDYSMPMQAAAMILDPRALAAHIGRKTIPDTGGRGVPVLIKLGGGR